MTTLQSKNKSNTLSGGPLNSLGDAMRTLVLVATLIISTVATATPFCQWEITSLDGKTREIRTFRPGPSTTELPLPRMKGFRNCRIPPVKHYEVNGVQATRIDFWCFTNSGDAVNIGSVASTQFGTDVTTFQLLTGPVTFTTNPDGGYQVNSNGYVEISAVCQ